MREFSGLLNRWQLQQEREDRRAATICAVLAELQRDPKKRKRPFEVKDFMPKFGGNEPSGPEQMLRVVHSLHLLYSGGVK